jgi:hypothetical protein
MKRILLIIIANLIALTYVKANDGVYCINGNEQISTHNADKKISKSNKTYNDFLKLFPLWDKTYLNSSVLTTNAELGNEYGKFFPDSLNRKFKTQEQSWGTCFRIKQDSIDVLFIHGDCTGMYKGNPYSEGLVVTFDKSGRFIDYCPIARFGELWRVRIQGSSSPLVLTIKQRTVDGTEKPISKPLDVTYSTNIYRVERGGKIIKTPSDKENALDRQKKKAKSDTLFIGNRRCALFAKESQEETEMAPEDSDNDEDYDVANDDVMWYTSQASDFLKKHKIRTIYVDPRYSVVCFNHTYCVSMSRVGMSDVVLYNPVKRPKIISAVEIEDEYKTYFRFHK